MEIAKLNCLLSSNDPQYWKRALKKRIAPTKHTIEQVKAVIKHCIELYSENRIDEIRQIHYLNNHIPPSRIKQIAIDLSVYLGIRHYDFVLLPQSKGVMMSLQVTVEKFNNDGRLIYFNDQFTRIPAFKMIKIVFIKDRRSLLVICESEGYCNRMVNDPTYKFNVTFISGKGYPDDATLLFLKHYGPRFIK